MAAGEPSEAGGASAGAAGALDCPCLAWRRGQTDTAGGLGSQGAMHGVHVRFSIISPRRVQWSHSPRLPCLGELLPGGARGKRMLRAKGSRRPES
jgi:hypothetical protein